MTDRENPMSSQPETLKSDTFGRILAVPMPNGATLIRRDLSTAPWWARWLARSLAKREATALARLGGRTGFPRLYGIRRDELDRSFVVGEPMYVAKPTERTYYIDALRRLRIMHRCGIAHNDLAKEPNWLVTRDGKAAIVDFQLATVHQRRGRWFRLLAREDLRHYLKHKRTYRPEALTAREKAILATPAITARVWQQTGKKLYLFVTRKILHWSDREGAGDRGKR